MTTTISSAPWPLYAEDEIEAVQAVLRSGKVNYWTGEEGRKFETAFAQHCGVKYAVALANGSVALELCLRVLGIGDGAEVVTTPRSFIASASCAVLQGARPVFADVDADSQNITAETIARAMTPKTKAIITVHHAGWPCEMGPIMAFARENGLKVIEDCAQAHGAMYDGKPVGSFGDASAFSFCQDKIITTGGEGGMLVTNNKAVWEKAWSFKDHGKSYDAVYHQDHTAGFRWLHKSFGTNWRMTEMQAAIGRIQLAKLAGWTAERQHNAGVLADRFSSIPGLRVVAVPAHISHAYYRYYVFLKSDQLARNWTRGEIISEITARGVSCFSGSCPEIYQEEAFNSNGLRPRASLDTAKIIGEESLAFLVHPALGDEALNFTADVVGEVMDAATA